MKRGFISWGECRHGASLVEGFYNKIQLSAKAGSVDWALEKLLSTKSPAVLVSPMSNPPIQIECGEMLSLR